MYEIFDPKINGPLHEASRKDARGAYNWFIENIEARLQQLELITRPDGIALDFSTKSLSDLDQWFYDRAKIGFDKGVDSVSSEVFSICNDLGMCMSEMLIRLPGDVSWEFFTKGKKNVAYHRAVISGFSNVKNRNYNIDYDFLLCQYAHRILKDGKQEKGLILDMHEVAVPRI